MLLTVVFFSYSYLSWFALVVQGLWLAWFSIQGKKSQEGLLVLRRGLVFVAVVQIVEIITYGLLLWVLIANHQHGNVFLPPHNSFLLIRVAQNTTALLAGWIASAVLFIVLSLIFVRRGHGMLLDGNDVLLLVLCAAVVGWPEVLLFLAILFALTIIWMIVLIIRKQKTIQDRIIITPMIIPAAIITIIFHFQLLAITHLGKIRF